MDQLFMSGSKQADALAAAHRGMGDGPESRDGSWDILFNGVEDGIMVLSPSGAVLRVNAACARMHGYSGEEAMSGLPLERWVAPEFVAVVTERVRLAVNEPQHFEAEHCRRDGTRLLLRVTARRLDKDGAAQVVVFQRDLTEERRTERLCSLSEEVFRILSDPCGLPAAADRILEAARRELGIEAAGIRLHKDADFPFAAASGYSSAFLEAENCLTMKGPGGAFCRDEHGKVRLECTCGLVLACRTVPGDGRFTPGGTAWTNTAGLWRETPADGDAARAARTGCLREGFQSVALVPIRVGRDVIGLLQLSDRRRGIFTAGMVRHLEGLAASFGVILQGLKRDDVLRESELRLGEAQQLAQLGSWSLDLETNRLECSNELKRILERDPDGVDGAMETWLAEVHPDDRDAVRRAGEQAVRDGVAFNREHRLRLADGRVKHVQSRFRADYNREGRAVRWLGTLQDITERKIAEEALAAELTRRRILIEDSRDGIVVLDWEGRVFEANRRFSEMLGYTAEEVLKLHVWDWDRGWPRDQVLEAIRLMGPEGARFETRHWRKDGTFYDVELSNNAAVLGGQKLVFCVCHDITSRKQAMEALAAREEVFSTIVGQAVESIVVQEGPMGRFVEFNTAAHEGLGYTREEFAGFAIRDIQAEHSQEVIEANLAHLRRHGSIHFETKHRHRDSSIRDVRVRIRSLKLRGRDCMAAVWTDITDLKRAEARERRDHLRTEFLLELHQRAPQMTDRDLYRDVLDRAVQLTGSATGSFHLVSEDQRTVHLTSRIEVGARVLDSKGPYPVEEAGPWRECMAVQGPVVREPSAGPVGSGGIPPGTPGWSRSVSIPVIQDGRVRLVFEVEGHAEAYTEDDVTQLQVVANELHKIMVQRTSENQLRQLSRVVEQSPVSVVITDPQGRIEYTNPKFTQVSGYSLEEVRGRTPQVLKSGEMPTEHYRQLWRTVLSGHAWHGEFHNRKKNGELHWESASISPITDPTGRITHFVAVKEDISEQKQLEQQLRQAQKLEAVGQLAGGVAHDFNNILAAIMMHLGLIKMNPGLDTETRDFVKELETETGRAAALTRQLLMFSRRSVLAIQPQDMNDVVTNLLKMLSRLIGENIRLGFEGASTLPSVEADAGMLEQVLMNLVVNARDAMPKGGRITISTALVDVGSEERGMQPDRRQGRFVTLSVTDTGTGMDDATLKRIFEPFFTTKEAGRGTGLGLATVHGIVAQHRGWVEVESVVGQGSTFRVFFPAMVRTGIVADEAVEPIPMQRGRETILLVEDEGKLRHLISRTLRGLGYRVYEAENGQDAMRTWQECSAQVDLLMTDMVMPEGMTGLELAERLQATRPSLKVIISSGYSAEIVHAGMPTQEGITYLPKPYSDQALADVVRKCLDRGG